MAKGTSRISSAVAFGPSKSANPSGADLKARAVLLSFVKRWTFGMKSYSGIVGEFNRDNPFR